MRGRVLEWTAEWESRSEDKDQLARWQLVSKACFAVLTVLIWTVQTVLACMDSFEGGLSLVVSCCELSGDTAREGQMARWSDGQCCEFVLELQSSSVTRNMLRMLL
jgi:hypothetical protein